MKSDSMDLLFHALAHAARRKILDLVRRDPGCSVGHVCAAFDCSRIAVLKHLRILEESQLILVKKEGRRRALYFNVVPIQLIYDRWTTDFHGFWATQAVDLKTAVESQIARERNRSPDLRAKKSPRQRKEHA